MEAEARLRWFAETGDSRQWTGPNDDADAHAGCRADIFTALATAEARGYARGIERAAVECEKDAEKCQRVIDATNIGDEVASACRATGVVIAAHIRALASETEGK